MGAAPTAVAGGVDDVVRPLHRPSRHQHVLCVWLAVAGHELQGNEHKGNARSCGLFSMFSCSACSTLPCARSHVANRDQALAAAAPHAPPAPERPRCRVSPRIPAAAKAPPGPGPARGGPARPPAGRRRPPAGAGAAPAPATRRAAARPAAAASAAARVTAAGRAGGTLGEATAPATDRLPAARERCPWTGCPLCLQAGGGGRDAQPSGEGAAGGDGHG